jgi:FKBP-type peptidyl-prolyl cis-trans isomerase 2
MIEEGKQVSIEYTLTLGDGTKADSNVGEKPLVYTQGAGEILPALEQALANLDVNDTTQITILPDKAYGVVDPNAYQSVELDQIPEEARTVGQTLVAEDDSGNRRPIRIHEVHDDKIVLDFNHPLAGQTLNFDVKVVAVE